MKRILASILALVMILAVSPVALAAQGKDGLTWELTDGTLAIRGSGAMPDYTAEVAPWRAKDKKAKNVKAISVESGITHIGSQAFQYCESVKSAWIADSVKSIGQAAFFNCKKMTSVRMPAELEEIEESTFDHCEALKSIVIPEGTEIIGNAAFNCCTSLEWVYIPASVTEIEDSAFNYCIGLKKVYYGGDWRDWDEIEIAGYNKMLTGAEISFNCLPPSSEGSASTATTDLVTVPAQTAAPSPAYSTDSERARTAERLFAQCLSSHPEYKLAAMLDVNKDGVNELLVKESKYAYETVLYALSPDGKQLQNWTLWSRDGNVGFTENLQILTVHSSGTGLLEHCVIDLYEDEILVCHIGRNHAWPDRDTVWYGFSVDMPGKESGEIQYSFGIIEDFQKNTISPDPQVLEDFAISEETYNWWIETFIDPAKSVEFLETETLLRRIGVGADVAPESGRLTWELMDGTLTIRGSGAMSDYTAEVAPWRAKDKKAKNVKEISVESGITHIGSQAFQYCESVKTAWIADSVKSIGQAAFFNCKKMTSVRMPAELREIEESTFDHCEALKSIVIPEGTEIIGNAAFNCCTSLEWVYIPASVTEIEDSAFNYCISLKKVYYGGDWRDWDEIEIAGYNKMLTGAENSFNCLPPKS